MTEPSEPGPLKRTIPPDLQREVEAIQTKVPRTTGPPGDLEEEKKRWLIVGICLHSIISPLLRKYVDPIISNLYNSLVSSDSVDTQGCHKYLKKYPVTNRYCLNYESINNNRKLNKNYKSYDYKITTHVDLSKLFLQPNMAQYTAIDESCDSSALLGMVSNISAFPSSVQTDAEKIRSDIRNPWAHCDFTEWTTVKYTDSFNLMGQFVKDTGLSNREENRILGELNTWATNGQNFLSCSTLGVGIVEDIRQQTNVLSRYVQTLSSGTDSQFSKVQKELTRIEYDLQERIQILESKTKEHDETIDNLKKEIKNQVEDHIPQHIREKDVTDKTDKTVLKVSSPKLLLSCRLHIYKEAQFQRITLFTKKECNLLSPEFCLLEAERNQMLHKYLPGDIIDNPDDIIDDINQVTEHVDYFPLLCKLSKDKTSEEVKKLFAAPLISINQNINNIIHENEQQFCALVLCILFNDGFDTDWLKLGSVSERKNMKSDKLLHIVKEFDIDLSKQKHRISLKAGFSTLNGTYLKLIGTEYRMIHDKIYTMAAVICGQNLTECFIKYTPSIFIRDNVIFESLTEVHGNCDLIVLFKDQEEEYFARLLCDLKKHVIISTFSNYQLIYETFRRKLISFLKRKNDANTVLRKLDTEGCKTIKYGSEETHCYTTPLIESATTGYFDIVEFLIINVKCDVNKTDEEGNSPLHKASERGHTAVAKLLLENNADVNQCKKYRESPLYMACDGGHKDIVELLLKNNADVNQCNHFDMSPLYTACAGGHKDIVELLLQNNADVASCNLTGDSPLYAACERGHKDIVELLFQNNGDVSQCNKYGTPPLFMACYGGHKDTVELLLQNNADVNQCTEYGESPLYMACSGGHKDTVELLLQNNADVNQCGEVGMSPLYLACDIGYKDIVELLLQNNADVNQCGEDGISPLYLACDGGHKDIVELLLQNNADVDQCDKYGTPPLYVACAVGHKDIVELLLQNNADANQCVINVEFPLYVACKRAHIETVELLLQKNADVLQCNTKGESPLHAVCSAFDSYYKFRTQFLKRIIETVKLLLAWKADVTLLNKNGQTPLDIAHALRRKELVNLFEENLQLKE